MNKKPTNGGSLQVRPLSKGMGEAVAKRTVLRDQENWGDVADRVAIGNAALHPRTGINDIQGLRDHIANGSILMSGRHLQHGDYTQPSRNMEVFTNCSTAAASHVQFLLALNGSGIGRCYDDAMMIVDWAPNMPAIHNILSAKHPDFHVGTHNPSKEYEDRPGDIYFRVPDSREGWAQAMEKIEMMSFEGGYADHRIVLDWSDIRPYGTPIGGMQERPASGPAPCIEAFDQVNGLRGQKLDPWLFTMMLDHYLAACVVVGGARRVARMATKFWKDPGIFQFINLKMDYVDGYGYPIFWSSNNSIGVDAEFWIESKKEGTHAYKVLHAATYASYHHRTGEPGFINLDMIDGNEEGIEELYDGDYIYSSKFRPQVTTKTFYKALLHASENVKYKYIVNPCGEIRLRITGGYCVIADVVPYFLDNVDQAIDAFTLAGRALVRVNLMDAVYNKEVARTNRIGLGWTGFHEWAFNWYGAVWKDIINPDHQLWKDIDYIRDRVKFNITEYCKELGVNVPHTMFTFKPAGTTSKLFDLTEGAHLPAVRAMLRWVQFRHDDPKVQSYIDAGYPNRELTSYKGTVIIGFPLIPSITRLIPPEYLTTATEATPDEQYQFLRNLEANWADNQISYTLKMDVEKVSYEEYVDCLQRNQSTVACCSVMPFSASEDASKYEYLPEEPVSLEHLIEILEGINDTELKEEIDMEALKCSSGACPI
jgi:adenosylcobalamin-dependent ribonucleoside-triphosphate reductase